MYHNIKKELEDALRDMDKSFSKSEIHNTKELMWIGTAVDILKDIYKLEYYAGMSHEGEDGGNPKPNKVY